MRRKLQFAGGLIALGLSAALAVPAFAQGPRANWAQNRQDNKPPKQRNQPPRQQSSRQPQRQEQRKVIENYNRQRNLSPADRQEIKKREETFSRLTPEQKDHVRNDLAPKWKQLPPDRQRAIQQRLGVLQNMPESARNQHLNDPNFTRGMSEEDKAMLRDLSHLHVGAPDPPNE